MTKPGAKKKPKPKAKIGTMANLELRDDAWPEFERLLKGAAKMGPKPHMTEKKKPAR